MPQKKSPVKAVKKALTKAKASIGRAKARSAKSSKALTTKVRKAMPKTKAAQKTAARPQATARTKARRAPKKDVSLLSALKEGLEVLGESILPTPLKKRARRR